MNEWERDERLASLMLAGFIAITCILCALLVMLPDGGAS